MPNPSNLYAEKVFSEHPLALWALDEQVDYITLISNAQRNIQSVWTVTDGTAYVGTAITGEPLVNSPTTILKGNVPSGSTNEIVCISPDIVNFSNMDQALGTFCVGTYFYSNTAYLTSVSIGYEYTDTTTSSIVQQIRTFDTSIFNVWSFVSETFEIPRENTNLRLVIKFNTTSGGATANEYEIHTNGLTLGQWSEEFNTGSLGVTTGTVPSDVSLFSGEAAVPASAYGISSDIGYYLTDGYTLYAKNRSLPLVYGASNITKLVPRSEEVSGVVTYLPSLIIPGKGVFNKKGQYNNYTVEFWARINSNASTPKRIFGPISSTDGLYVEGGFLTLVVGKTYASYFVGEWFRPMLIHISIIKDSASVLINGEEVISLSFTTSSLILPDELDSDGKNQNWLGFYSYDDIDSLEIDCVGLYSYKIPTIVAKRRFVYGQGVGSTQDIDSIYGGSSVVIDYPFANYTANYSYPDFAQWQQGTFDNLVTTTTSLATPKYNLPEIFLSSGTLQELYDDNQSIQSGLNKFISFKPNSTWNTRQAYFNFPKFNIINDSISSIYGVFSSTNLSSEETLFKIYNSLSGNYFSVQKNADKIHYYLFYNGVQEEIYTSAAISSGQTYAAGINIDSLISYFGGNVASFFGNQNGLNMYVAGETSDTYTFTGKIYSFGISSKLNAVKTASYFNTNGTIILTESTNMLSHTASYTLLPTEAYEKFFLDIGISGHWEDYMPLSYFAKYVANDLGNEFYDLDFLQFNVGYPSPSKLLQGETTSPWTYRDLENQYKSPSYRTYNKLDNTLLTGWNDYQDMVQRSLKHQQYDTENSNVRTYITFQYIIDGANLLDSSFTTTVAAVEGSIIFMDDYPDWLVTKFEVVNNTLIYPRSDIDFNSLAIVYSIDFNTRNTVSKTINLKSLQIASQAFSQNSFNNVGTKFGLDIFPYKKSGFYYDYKSKNPFSIYKGSTPYLYMTRYSGIEIRGDVDPTINRGISIPINKSVADYHISAIQMWLRYDQNIFPGAEIDLFEINYKGDTIKFYIVADSEKGTRGRIFSRSLLTGSEINGMTYYWNGKLVREPVLTANEWGVLGISFATSLNFDSYLGAINLNGPAVFNNISYYQSNNLQQAQTFLVRPWTKVKQDGASAHDWQYWDNNFSWHGVLVVSSFDLYGVYIVDVYNTYLGTNKIIIDDSEGMILDAEKLTLYTEASWQISVNTPV